METVHQTPSGRNTQDYHKWRYCPTHDNPSDVGTRGIDPVKFDNSEFWTKGPTWLREDKSMWPANQRSSATEDSEKEKVKTFATYKLKKE